MANAVMGLEIFDGKVLDSIPSSLRVTVYRMNSLPTSAGRPGHHFYILRRRPVVGQRRFRSLPGNLWRTHCSRTGLGAKHDGDQFPVIALGGPSAT